MQTLRQILVCASLAALCLFLGFATYGVWIITGVAEQLPERMEAAVIETRGQLLAQITTTSDDLLKHLTALELRTDARLGSIQADARLELAATRELVATRLDASLARADTALGEVHALRSDLRPSLDNLAGISEHALHVSAHTDEATAILFARNALPAQLLGVLGATKVTMGQTAETMRDIQRATPQMIATWQEIGVDAHSVTVNIKRLTAPHWYDRALGYGATALRIYRDLNPGFNITFGANQAVGSKP